MNRRFSIRGMGARAITTSTAVVALLSSMLVVGIEATASAVSVTGTIPVQTNPLDVALNPAGTVAYVANFTSNTISVINLATNSVTKTITVGTNPCRVVVDPTDTFAYVANANSNNVSVIQLSTNTVVKTLALPANAFPEQIVVNSSNTDAYVVDRGINEISVIALPGDTVTTPYKTGNSPEGIVVNSTDAYVTNRNDASVSVIDLSTGLITKTITVGTSPSRLAANPAGTYLYATNRGSNTVSVIQVSSNSVVATVPVGYTPDAVAVDPSGQDAYISNTSTSSNSVSVIKLSNNTVVQTLKVGTDPEGIAVNSAGTYAYVVNYSTNNVSIFEMSNQTVTFDGNGATSGSVSPETNNVPATLTVNAFARTGYTFKGWNTAATGGGTAYANGATYPFSASTTLYAQWSANALGSMTGTVTASGGASVAKICVYLYPVGTSTLASYAACTGSNGTYSLSNVAPANYDVAFSDPNGVYATQWSNGSTGGSSTQAGAAAVSIPSGGTLSGVNAVMSVASTGNVTGAVTAASSGANLAGICVYLYPVGASGASYAACTGSNGTYSIANVGSGNYDVAFSDPNGVYATQWSNGSAGGAPTQGGAVAVMVPKGGGTLGGVDAAMS